jgi:hypothetical protein
MEIFLINNILKGLQGCLQTSPSPDLVYIPVLCQCPDRMRITAEGNGLVWLGTCSGGE